MLLFVSFSLLFVLFFFPDPPTTWIYTFPYTTLFRSVRRSDLAGKRQRSRQPVFPEAPADSLVRAAFVRQDRKSTRLNSSHLGISYAVFCLKKKKKTTTKVTTARIVQSSATTRHAERE